MSSIRSRLESLEANFANIGEEFSKTVIGFVCPQTKQLVTSYKLVGNAWLPTNETPTAYFALKLEPLFTRPKRFNVLIGGRGSGKSLGKGGHGAIGMHDLNKNLMCIREYQNSIADSVHSLLGEEIKRLELSHADITEKTIRFSHNNSMCRFQGLSRNPESVKSAFGFLDWWIEEAQFLSEKSLRVLTPTARAKPKKGLPGKAKEVDADEVDLSKVTMTFCANPASSEDPFSQRFVVPYRDQLDKDGIYEDDLHLIIDINYWDNPWFEDSGLEAERAFDEQHMSRSTYEWVWCGGFNDDIDNALIKSDWFDACIDAHEKLGFKAAGVTKVIHDPSDLGGDAKAVAVRKGNVFTELTQRDDLDVNEGSDWALGIANDERADQYIWDVGGMGVTLKRDVNSVFDGTKTQVYQFNGAHGVEDPDDIFERSDASNPDDKKNKDQLRNLRAQCYLKLRNRVYKTFLAVTQGKMYDPSELISISSKCEYIKKARSELCRLPIKPDNQGFAMYSKQEMRDKFKVKSPNISDSMMMSEVKYIMPLDNEISGADIRAHYKPRYARRRR